jgi:hypothetical protein
MLTNGRHVSRNGYNNYRKRKKNKCVPYSKENTFVSPMPNSCFSLEDYESYVDNIQFVTGIATECQYRKDTSIPYPCTKLKFWMKYIKLPLPPKNLVWYAQGALFSVTREQIHRRPLEDYKMLLDDFSNSTGNYLGYLMEWFWYPLVTNQYNICDEKYYISKTPSKRFKKIQSYFECNDCSFNESNYR